MGDKESVVDIAKLALAGNYAGIESRIVEIDTSEIDFDIDAEISGRFFYLSFKNNLPTVDEFVEYLYWHLIPFCIPRKKREEYDEKFRLTQDYRYPMELADQAKELFVKSIDSVKRSGELGEAILFVLLEAFMGAPQVACKMFLKTSRKMHVHGSDSVHILFDDNTGCLELLWGESKIYSKLSSSLDEICSSVGAFIEENDEPSPRERDIEIVKDHPNISDPQLCRAFLKYFDPYEREYNDTVESFCCFSGFEYSQYEKLKKMPSPKMESFFQEKYKQRIKSAVKLFDKKIHSNNIEKLKFYFFLLPFPDIYVFRKAFYKKLGLKVETIDSVKSETEND